MHHISWFGQTVKIPDEKLDEVITLIERLRKAGIDFKHVFYE